MQQTQNRVWFECEHPDQTHPKATREERDAIGKARAKLMTNLLRRLGVLANYKGDDIVFWHSDKNRYGWTVDEAGGFMIADDHGHWYNLDYLGRDLDGQD